MLIVAFFLYFYRIEIAMLFSKDKEIIEITANCMLVLAIVFTGDGIQATVVASIRALALQKWAALLSFIAYYIIAIPVGSILMFTSVRLGNVGLWTGIVTGVAFLDVAMVILVLCSNWERIAANAASRLE